MADRLPTSPAGRAALAVAVATALIALVAVVFDLGPCADELSAEEFVAQGDEICAVAHDEFEDLQNRAPRTPTEAADLTGELVDVAEEERDAISDLAEPESLRERVVRYLEARDRGIDRLRNGLAAAEDADPDEYARLQAELAGSQVDPRYEIAREIGFRECSKPLVGRAELRRQSQPPAPTDPGAPPQVDNPE